MKTIEVVAAVIRSGSRIFATQRGYGEFKDGWEFPGGKVEPGESPEEALVREIHEELDAEIEVGELIDIIEYDYDNSAGAFGHKGMQSQRDNIADGFLFRK